MKSPACSRTFKNRFSKLCSLSILGAALLVVSAGASFVSAQSLDPVRFLVPIRNVDEGYAAFVVAKELGYFKEEGLDVSILPVNGSNEAAIQVAAGNGDVGLASPAQAVIGMQSGDMDIRYFYNLYYSNIWSIAVLDDSPIESIKDLRGKKIGVPATGSAAITYGRAYLASAGLDPQKDAAFISIGFGGQAFAATQQKVVDAIIFYDVALLQFGIRGLKLRTIDIPEKLKFLPDASLLARNDWLKKNPKVAIGFSRALSKAHDFTITNPEAAVKLTWKSYPDGKPRGEEAEVTKIGVLVSQTRMKIWAPEGRKDHKHGYFYADAWKNAVDFMVDQKMLPAPIPVERIYTNQFIDPASEYDRQAVIQQAKAYQFK